mgnify:CR=1 FL=1
MPKMPLSLQSPISRLKGIGTVAAANFAKLGIKTLADLLLHLPTNYQDRTRIFPIAQLVSEQYSLVEGKLISAKLIGRSRGVFACELQDVTGVIGLRFFNAAHAQQRYLASLKSIRCFGKVQKGLYGFEMIHPQCQATTEPLDKCLTAIYPATAGLHQTTIRKAMQQALTVLAAGQQLEQLDSSLLPDSLAGLSVEDALVQVHQPSSEYNATAAVASSYPPRQRLAFEELLAQRLHFLQLKRAQQARTAVVLEQTHLVDKLRSNLPFSLTSAQERVTNEINTDLAAASPMVRLLQGDVGSGKTLVALLAMLQAVSNGYQAVLMAPTDILSEQHFNYCRKLLDGLDITVVRLSGKMAATDKLIANHQITHGSEQIIIGTQALFQEQVEFFQLALVVIDEQHKFGVQQRLALVEKSGGEFAAHQLIMSATPIPRTLAMSVYADLDISTIDELPPGRTPITTSVVHNDKRSELTSRIVKYCQSASGQVYWVCPLIDESEKLSAQAAAVVHEQLTSQLPKLTIGLVHGRMGPTSKQKVMAKFSVGEIDLLVATSVIEVGVDVANASLMIIDNAERLSLTQMHQLRGRVGRGAKQSYCVLLHYPPITQTAHLRLETMREHTCGFAIAEKDLAMRGCGELLGAAQSGLMQFKVADLARDQGLFVQVQETANKLLSSIASGAAEQQQVIDTLIERWCPNLLAGSVNV